MVLQSRDSEHPKWKKSELSSQALSEQESLSQVKRKLQVLVVETYGFDLELFFPSLESLLFLQFAKRSSHKSDATKIMLFFLFSSKFLPRLAFK